MAVNDFSEEASTPATPTTGRWKLYPKSTGWFFLDDAGVETSLTSGLVSSTKLPTVGCTQAAGALTFTAASMYLDFRSTTLTSGTPSTVLAAPSDLVLPSGGTLGTVTTVQARLILVELNNAGTAELAIINIAGGNSLDETGVINTTAIGTGSDSNNVFYSTTARTGVAYRVVGAVDVVNTAGAWADPVLVQPAGGRALAYQMLTTVAIPTTSGTSHDVTGIPSWVKRITVMFNGVSLSGASQMLMQIGDDGGIESTGYIAAVLSAQSGAVSSTTLTSTSGFPLTNSNDASYKYTGYISLLLFNNTEWIESGTLVEHVTGPRSASSSGTKTLSGTLDRIRLTTVNGTDTFDAGSFKLILEG